MIAGISRILKITSWDGNWVTGVFENTQFMPGVQEVFISSNSKNASESLGSAFGHGSSRKTKRAFVEAQRGPWLLNIPWCSSVKAVILSFHSQTAPWIWWNCVLREAWQKEVKWTLKKQPELVHLCKCYFEADLVYDHILVLVIPSLVKTLWRLPSELQSEGCFQFLRNGYAVWNWLRVLESWAWRKKLLDSVSWVTVEFGLKMVFWVTF